MDPMELFEQMFDIVDGWMRGDIDSASAVHELAPKITALWVLERGRRAHKAAHNGGSTVRCGTCREEEARLGPPSS